MKFLKNITIFSLTGLLALAAVTPLPAQEAGSEETSANAKTVLWLGTAISSYHGLNQQVVEVLEKSEAFGPLELKKEYVWPLSQFFLPDDHPEKRTHKSLQKREELMQYIAEEKPEYLVIQTTLNYFLEEPGDFAEVIRKLTNAAKAQGGEVIFYETGWPTRGGSQAEIEKLDALAQELGATVVPCFRAQELYRETYPDADWTYEGDQRHPGKRFIYLNKLLFSKVLTGGEAEVSTTYPYRDKIKDEDGKDDTEMITVTLPEEEARKLREVAENTLEQEQS